MPVHPIDELLVGSPEAVRVPLIGQALCAGFPSPADDFLEGALELPRWLVPNPPATFLWRISGSSMEGAGIFDRDLACVDRSLKPGHGSVVVAAIDGEMSCKRAAMAAGVQDQKRKDDQVATAAAVILFWPSAFFIDCDNAKTAELARLKGEMEALEQASIQKNCGVTFRRG